MTVWCVRIFLQMTTCLCTGRRRTASAKNKAFTFPNNLINRAVNVLVIDNLKYHWVGSVWAYMYDSYVRVHARVYVQIRTG